MKMTPSISSKILDELITTLEVIGIENTIKTLQDAKNKTLILGDLDVDFVLKSVEEVTGVSKERILYGTDRNDDRKISLALCVYFIKSEFSYSLSELKRIFKKDESGLSRYFSLVENVPKTPKTEFDERLLNYMKKINLIISERKLKNNVK
jgi:hypothetical protein